MSSANGMKQSFDQFKYYQGSIIKLSTVKDLGLSANQAPSMTGNYDFMVTGSLSNPDVQSLNALVPGKKYTIMIVTELNGIGTISNKKVIQQPAIISATFIISSFSLFLG